MGRKETVIMSVFFMAMVLCGCSVETACDNIASAVIAVFTLMTACACAWVLGGGGNGAD